MLLGVGHGDRPRRHAPQARRHPVRAQRLLPRPRPLPRARRRRRGAAGAHGVRLPHLLLRRRGGADHALRSALGRDLRPPRAPGHLPGDAVRHLAGHDRALASARSATSSRSRSSSSSRRGSCSRPTGSGSAPSTTWRCCRSSATATGSRTTRASSTGARRARRRTRCSTTSRTTSSSCSTSRTRRCLSWAGMYEGDRSRKETLVEYGFRLPSALDNRPLRFDEFLDKVPQLLFVSATPGPFELRNSTNVAEQIIRPTGVVDPEVELRSTKNQIDDLLNEVRRREEAGERVLVTTLTKKMAEDLTDYLLESGVRARYLHSEIDTLDRIRIIRELRLGEYDVLVGRQPAARGARPARGLARGDPRRGQGGLPARADVAHPDDRPRCPQRERQGRHVRGQADRGDEGRDGGDEPPARDSAPLQRGARDHARVDRQGRLRHRRVPRARVAARPGQAPARAARSRACRPEELEKLVVTLEEEMFAAAEELRFEYAAKLRDEIKDLRRELQAAAEPA